MVVSSNVYISNMVVYVGVQPGSPYTIIDCSGDVAMSMCSNISGPGRNIAAGSQVMN